MKKNFRRGMSKTLVFLLATTAVANIQGPTAKAQDSVENKLRQAIYNNLSSEFSKSDKFAGTPKLETPFNDNSKLNTKDENEIVRVIVQLEKPSASETTKKAKASNSEIQAVKASQLPIINQAKNFDGAEIRHSYGNVINGFSMEVKRGELSKLEDLPGVKKVTEVEKFSVDMTSAKDLTQALNTWKDYGYQGEGMLVSIIDTGIDHTHKDMRLDADGLAQAKLSKAAVNEKIKALGRGTYLSEKVPFGFNYADKSNLAKDTTTSMHGMHVAGISVANGADEEVKTGKAVDGVAPDAQVLAMKVFSNGPLSASAFSDDVVAAIEDSVTLGADVINMSLGSSGGFMDPEDPQQIAIKKATDAGVVVVVSAGNSQYSTAPNKYSSMKDIGASGSPGVAKDTIQVANFEGNKITLPVLNLMVDGSKASTFGYMESDFKFYQSLKADGEYEVLDCGTGKPEDFQGKNIKGKIALIERGGNTFIEKKLNAQKAGAIGAIIYNNERADAETYISMASDPQEKIPGAFVKRSSGVAIKTALNGGKKVLLKFGNDVIYEDNLNAGSFDSSTSWGIAPNLEFKPEIAAPGGDIYSTFNNDKYGIMSGTSMAAPHVSGAQALIVQAIKKANPNISGRDLSRLARFTSINTAEVKMDKDHPDTPYSPRRQGAGMIQIKDAIDNRVILTYKKDGNAVTALKEIGKVTEFDLELENMGDKPVTYEVSSLAGVLTDQEKSLNTMHYVVKLPQEQGNITFNSNTVTVPAKGKATVKATLKIADGVSPERFIEGFVKFIGKDVPDLVMPYVGYYGDWNKEEIINVPVWKFNDPSFKAQEHNELPQSLMLTKATKGSKDAGEKLKEYFYLGYNGEDKDKNIILDPETIAISPNGDGEGDVIIPYLYHLRNAKSTSVVVLDKDGKELGTVATESNIKKKFYNSEKGKTPEAFNKLAWDGKLYNNKTGKYEVVPEGQYTIDIRSSVDLPNAKPQSFKVPVKIDLTAPKVSITGVSLIKDKSYKLQWTMKDNESSIEKNAYAVSVNNEVLKDLKVAYDEATGVYSTEITLPEGYANVSVASIDRAHNMAVDSYNHNLPSGPAEVTFDNVKDGAFETKDGETYTIKGKLNKPVKSFKIAGNAVTVKPDLSFEQEVKLSQGDNKISLYLEDLDGKVIADYSIKATCDTAKPVINFTTANISEDKTALFIGKDTNKVTIKGSVADNTYGYKFYINGKAIITVDNNVQGAKYNERIFAEEIAVKAGDIIAVKAVDNLGNETNYSLVVKEQSGWMKLNENWLYFDNTGMRTGWVKDNNSWYFLNEAGIMKTGWINLNGSWYYLESNGAMKTGWVSYSGKWYYLKATGEMAVNTTINGYKIGADGAWLP